MSIAGSTPMAAFLCEESQQLESHHALGLHHPDYAHDIGRNMRLLDTWGYTCDATVVGDFVYPHGNAWEHVVVDEAPVRS